MLIGSLIYSSYKTRILLGNSCFIKYIPRGTFIHNVELRPRQGSKLSRSSGSYLKILRKFKKYTLVKLKSGFKKILLSNSFATIGVISDYMYYYKIYFRNAGKMRNIG